MKNYLLVAAGIAAFVAVGCSDDDPQSSDPKGGKVTLQASFAEKTLSGNDLLWAAGDKLNVFTAGSTAPTLFMLSDGAGKASATFTAETKEEPADYAAIYPSGEEKYADGKFTLTLPLAQTPDSQQPMFAASQTTALAFKNLLGGIELPIKGDDGVEVISVEFTAKSAKVSGSAEVDAATGAVTMADNANTSVTSNCRLSLGTTAQTLIISLPPQQYDEYTVTLTDTQGETLECDFNDAITVERGKLTKLPEIEFSESSQLSDLSGKESANCYIVPMAGTYSFDATRRGNETQSTLSPGAVEVIWSDAANLIDNLTLADGRVSFSVGETEGNAVIGVKVSAESEEYLWSWHIWRTGQPSDQTYPSNKYNHTYTVMDRALGALTAERGETRAMLYQWGRKDPFTNQKKIYLNGTTETAVDKKWYKVIDYTKIEDDANNNVTYAIQHPDTYISGKDRWCKNHDNSLWGNSKGASNNFPDMMSQTEKTAYDPCPPGYRIAPKDTWIDWDGIERDGNFEQGYTFLYDGVNGSWYSAAGSRCCQSNAMYNASGLYNVGTQAYYWTSSRASAENPNMFGYFEFYKVTIYPQSHFYASAAYAVRCVKEQ